MLLRVYLVKDESGKIALFFSMKCGLLVGENMDEKLSDVNTYICLQQIRLMDKVRVK